MSQWWSCQERIPAAVASFRSLSLHACDIHLEEQTTQVGHWMDGGRKDSGFGETEAGEASLCGWGGSSPSPPSLLPPASYIQLSMLFGTRHTPTSRRHPLEKHLPGMVYALLYSNSTNTNSFSSITVLHITETQWGLFACLGRCYGAGLGRRNSPKCVQASKNNIIIICSFIMHGSSTLHTHTSSAHLYNILFAWHPKTFGNTSPKLLKTACLPCLLSSPLCCWETGGTPPSGAKRHGKYPSCLPKAFERTGKPAKAGKAPHFLPSQKEEKQTFRHASTHPQGGR